MSDQRYQPKPLDTASVKLPDALPAAENMPYTTSVKALIRNAAGQYLMLQRSAASKANAGKWDFPGGKVDTGETLDQALLREVREETGLAISVLRVVGAAESVLPTRKVAYVLFEASTDENAVRLSEEHSAFRWLTRDQLVILDVAGQFIPFLHAYLRE